MGYYKRMLLELLESPDPEDREQGKRIMEKVNKPVTTPKFTCPATCGFHTQCAADPHREQFCGCYSDWLQEQAEAVTGRVEPADPDEDPFTALYRMEREDPEAYAAMRARLEAQRTAWKAAGRCEDCGSHLDEGRCYPCDQADSYENEGD